jgi:glucose/arabinose dehydrogenase
MLQRPDLFAEAITPDYALSSHAAPLGPTFYSDTALPEAYSGALSSASTAAGTETF